MPQQDDRMMRNDQRMAIAAALTTGTVVVAVVVLSRQWSGHDLAPLPAWASVSVSIAVALAALFGHLLRAAAQIDRNRSEAARFAVFVITVAPPAATALAVLPYDSGWAVGVTVASLAIAAIVAIGSDELVAAGWLGSERSGVFGAERSPQPSAPTHANSAGGEAQRLDSSHPAAQVTTETEAAASAPPLYVGPEPDADGSDTVVQWMTRSRAADGPERVEGGVTVCFAPGQRQAAAHLAFCPPLDAVPELHCESGDAAVRLRVTAAHAWGARIEAKRAGDSSQPAAVQIGFVAVTGAARSAA